ncbi:Immunogenic miracidial antigen 8I [Schistosoma japonicum]|nr:Immunogenic miracidial antigen 8I [Schistosoma japonicum]
MVTLKSTVSTNRQTNQQTIHCANCEWKIYSVSDFKTMELVSMIFLCVILFENVLAQPMQHVIPGDQGE